MTDYTEEGMKIAQDTLVNFIGSAVLKEESMRYMAAGQMIESLPVELTTINS